MIGFPLIYPLFASLAFQVGSKGVFAIGLSPLFYLAVILWAATGVGLQALRHWSWYTLGAAQVLTVYLNALNLVSLSQSEFKGFAFGLTLLVQFVIHTLVAREVRVPYLFPRIKWWESGIAGMHHISAEMKISEAAPVSGQLLDLSSKGCFVKTPLDFKVGEKAMIRLSAYGQEVELSGKIVWNARSTVTHPKGLGIQFFPLERTLRRKLKIITREFNEQKDIGNGLSPLSS